MTHPLDAGPRTVPPVGSYSSDDLLDALVGRGYDSLSGIPCSLFGDLFERVEERTDIRYLPAAREDLAVGVAAGVGLAGGRAIVAMQNSAVGMILNAVQSLVEMYGIHCLLLVSWRGEGPDAPEHVAMGRRMLDLLDCAGIPFAFASQLETVPAALLDRPGPVALIVRTGELARPSAPTGHGVPERSGGSPA